MSFLSTTVGWSLVSRAGLTPGTGGRREGRKLLLVTDT